MGIPDFTGLHYLTLSKELTRAPSAVLIMAEMFEVSPLAGNLVLEAASTAAVDFMEAGVSMAVVVGIGERMSRCMEILENSRREGNCHAAKKYGS